MLSLGILGASATDAAAASFECVYVLHGLNRTARSMGKLAAELAREGFAVRNLDYPSTRGTFLEFVAELRAQVESEASTCDRVHFVGYSLGALVVRAYLAEAPPPSLGRVVLLGPPNHGSEIVDAIGDTWIFRAVMGHVGRELGTGRDSLPNRIPPPTYPTLVIAGDRVISPIGWLLIPGEHDGTVSVASTRLEGATEHTIVHRSHTFLMNAPEVARRTIAFLRDGT